MRSIFGVGCGGVFGFVFDFVDVEFVVGGSGLVAVERGGHCAIAFAHGMNVAEGDAEHNRVVEHVGYVQVGVAVWDDKDVVAFVVIAFAIFDDDVIFRVDVDVKKVKASVAGHLYDSFAMKRAVVDVMALLKIKVHFDVGRVNAGVLHVLEKLRVAYEILLEMPVGQLSELHFKR